MIGDVGLGGSGAHDVSILVIALDEAPPKLLPCIALGFGVHGFELAAVDRDEVCVQKLDVATERDKLPTDLADRWAVIASDISDRLDVGLQATEQPDQIQIVCAFALQPER